MTALTTNEIIIDSILYNTKCESDRRFIGLYEEQRLLKFFINNNIKIEHISNENKYSPYDFIIKHNEIIYIIELKSRLGNIKHHTYELMSISKISKYKKICNKNSNYRCVFIFNHIDTDDNNKNDYFFYQIKFKELDDICFRFETAFQLPIRHIKPLNDFLEILK